MRASFAVLAVVALIVASSAAARRLPSQRAAANLSGCGVVTFSNGSSIDMSAISTTFPLTQLTQNGNVPGTYAWAMSLCQPTLCGGDSYLQQNDATTSCATKMTRMSVSPAAAGAAGNQYISATYVNANFPPWTTVVNMYCGTQAAISVQGNAYTANCDPSPATCNQVQVQFNLQSSAFCVGSGPGPAPPTPAPPPPPAPSACGVITFGNGTVVDLSNFTGQITQAQNPAGGYTQTGDVMGTYQWTISPCSLANLVVPACPSPGSSYFQQIESGACVAAITKMSQAPTVAGTATHGYLTAMYISTSGLLWGLTVNMYCGTQAALTVQGNAYTANCMPSTTSCNGVAAVFNLQSSAFCARAPTPPSPPLPPSKTLPYGGQTLFTHRVGSSSVFVQCADCFGASSGTIMTALVDANGTTVWSSSSIPACVCATGNGVAVCGAWTAYIHDHGRKTVPPQFVTMATGATYTASMPAHNYDTLYASNCTSDAVYVSGSYIATTTHQPWPTNIASAGVVFQTAAPYGVTSPPGAALSAMGGSFNAPLYWWVSSTGGNHIQVGSGKSASIAAPSCAVNNSFKFIAESEGVVVIACDGYAAGFDAVTLAPLWQFSTSAAPCMAWSSAGYDALPTIHGGHLYWACSTVFAVNIQTGLLAWTAGGMPGDFSEPGVVGNGYVAADTPNGLVVFNPYTGQVAFREARSGSGAVQHRLAPFQLGEYIVVSRASELVFVPFAMAPPAPTRRNITEHVYGTPACTGGAASTNRFTEGCNNAPAAYNASILLQCTAPGTMVMRSFAQENCQGAPSSSTLKMGTCYPLGTTGGAVWSGCP